MTLTPRGREMSPPVVEIFPDTVTLTRAAALLFTAVAQASVQEYGRFLVALSGGSTPQALFHLLRQSPYVAAIPWAQTHLYWGDERLVPPQEAGSNYGQAQVALLRHVPLPPNHLHRMKGELSPDAAVADYTQQLRALAAPGRDWPVFDLVLLGLGTDGHTASLFPGPISASERHTAVMAATAVYADRPAHRLTLTPLVLNEARHVLFLVTGEQKAKAVTAVLHGPLDPETWPAQRIQPTAGQLTWFLDKAASQLSETQESNGAS